MVTVVLRTFLKCPFTVGIFFFVLVDISFGTPCIWIVRNKCMNNKQSFCRYTYQRCRLHSISAQYTIHSAKIQPNQSTIHTTVHILMYTFTRSLIPYIYVICRNFEWKRAIFFQYVQIFVYDARSTHILCMYRNLTKAQRISVKIV